MPFLHFRQPGIGSTVYFIHKFYTNNQHFERNVDNSRIKAISENNKLVNYSFRALVTKKCAININSVVGVICGSSYFITNE